MGNVFLHTLFNIYYSGHLTLRDFAHSLRPLLTSAADSSFGNMMQQLQEKKNFPPEEIKFDAPDAADAEEWEISSWSALNLVPQSQSSAVDAGGEPAAEQEEGEINEEPENQDDPLLDDLMTNLPDFYHLIPKRHLNYNLKK